MTHWLIRKILLPLFFIILTISMGLYTGIKNTEDRIYQEYEFEEITAEVRVYRDEFGVPSIFASNMLDLLFVQGYEITRDRTFQMEQYRSLINGELSRMLGPDMLETDKSLRTIGLKRAGIAMLDKLETNQLQMVEAYAAGVNQFLEDHRHNQPMELQLLGVEAKPWDAADVVAMGSIVAFSWALDGLSSELLRLEYIREFGNEQTLELFPVDYPAGADFIRNVEHELLNNSNFALGLSATDNNFLASMEPLFGDINKIRQSVLQSNNWVVSGSKTTSGFPIVANDPHQSLEAQGIWLRCNLFLTDGSYTGQGFTFPGVPLITFGHNNHVAWGITAGLHDATDLYYLKQNVEGTSYLYNNSQWLDFEYIDTEIEIRGEDPVSHRIKLSQFGPMIETDEGEMAMRWTLYEGYERDDSIKALIDFNFAQNVDEFHGAIGTLLTGFNFVFADVDGNIASQVSGFLPIRKVEGAGLLPQNGSNGENDWIGLLPYEQQYYEKNPIKGYLVTANEKVDSNDSIYYGPSFAHRYRDDRISQVIENGIDFADIDPNKIDNEDMRRLQLDVKTLVAEDLLDPVIDVLQDADFSGEYADLTNSMVDQLSIWDKRLDIDSVVASVFITYRYMLTQETFGDELGELIRTYYYSSIRTMADALQTNRSWHWFDDIHTSSIEDANDIVIRAMEATIKYLVDHYGENTAKWEWGNLHRAVLVHPLNDITPLFNIGGDPIGGGVFTVLSSTENGIDEDGSIDFESNKAPYFRFVVDVEPSWSNMWGSISSGASDHPLSPHYSDAYESWIQNEYHNWLSSEEDIKQDYELTAIFREEVS